MQHSTGLALVSKYCTQMSASGVEVVANVVVKGYGGLLDCMERYCQGVGANVVVMGSAALTQVIGQGRGDVERPGCGC